jgi:hypothetical protein
MMLGKSVKQKVSASAYKMLTVPLNAASESASESIRCSSRDSIWGSIRSSVEYSAWGKIYNSVYWSSRDR